VTEEAHQAVARDVRAALQPYLRDGQLDVPMEANITLARIGVGQATPNVRSVPLFSIQRTIRACCKTRFAIQWMVALRACGGATRPTTSRTPRLRVPS
jgi:hypothetical protein